MRALTMRSLLSVLLGLVGCSKENAPDAPVTPRDRLEAHDIDPTTEPPTDGTDDGELAQLLPASPDRPIHVAFLMLHQPDPVLKRRIPSIESVAHFQKQVEQAVKEYLEAIPEGEGRTCSIIWAIKPNRQARFWIEYHPRPLDPTIHDALLDKLNELKPPVVRDGPVSFAMFGILWGGIGRDKHPNFSMIPREWLEAGGGVIPDGLLSKSLPD
jgi:hypothetical protein